MAESNDQVLPLESPKSEMKLLLERLYNEVHVARNATRAVAQTVNRLDIIGDRMDSKIEKLQEELANSIASKKPENEWIMEDGINYFDIVKTINHKFPGLLISLTQFPQPKPEYIDLVPEDAGVPGLLPDLPKVNEVIPEENELELDVSAEPTHPIPCKCHERELSDASTQTCPIDFLNEGSGNAQGSNSGQELFPPEEHPENHKINIEDPSTSHVRVPRKNGCWNCSSMLHKYADCDQPFDRIFCYHCSYEGFITADCPNCDGKQLIEGVHYIRRHREY
ncbi:uncharacterized protein LOC127283556 [Leptopilina boulardi]|uniref:uncharacterized protein LOC127283556 n=1 Tax=Leptopilina boulardi TaxID=63433 RepID=UPI0021F5BBA8|nr:uncharacterized protein LOC127283556 [Leptopilina boulardi]